MTGPAPRLESHPVHLGTSGRALAQPEFTGPEWYEGYVARTLADGSEGRLVSEFAFDAPWTSWELHPCGDEVVMCLAGEITLIQELENGHFAAHALAPGQYAINPRGVWHTADTTGPARALFITAGAGTEHRPR